MTGTSKIMAHNQVSMEKEALVIEKKNFFVNKGHHMHMLQHLTSENKTAQKSSKYPPPKK